MVNGEKVLIVTLHLSNNTLIDDCKRFVLIHLGTFTLTFSEEYSIVLEEDRNTITIILAGDFNIELKKKENDTFVINMEETFGLKSCVDMAFARSVDNLKCANYITYFSFHRPILSITNSTKTVC
jgi:endonuclease/exonuclease/phosphatase family metal-dependent hydrolase